MLYDLPYEPFQSEIFSQVNMSRPLSLASHNMHDLSPFVLGAGLHGNLFTWILGPSDFQTWHLILTTFDATRDLTGKDILFSKKLIKIMNKWSKIIRAKT